MKNFTFVLNEKQRGVCDLALTHYANVSLFRYPESRVFNEFLISEGKDPDKAKLDYSEFLKNVSVIGGSVETSVKMGELFRKARSLKEKIANGENPFELDESEFSLLSTSTDGFSRFLMGQVDAFAPEIEMLVFEMGHDTWEFKRGLQTFKKNAFGLDWNASLGIANPKVPYEGKVAYEISRNIQEVLRKERVAELEKAGENVGYSVFDHKGLKLSKEPELNVTVNY